MLPRNKSQLKEFLSTVRVLSIRQPWARAIVSHKKRVENRSWRTKYRGPILIHAGQLRSRRAYEEDLDWLRDKHRANAPDYDHIQSGGIVGVASLVDVRPNGKRPRDTWAQADAEGWHLKNAKSVEFVPMLGRLGLFQLSAVEVRRVLKAWE